MRTIFLLSMLCFLFLCGCVNILPASQENSDNNQDSTINDDENSNQTIITYDGKTAVLLEDITLSNAYSALTDNSNQITWVNVSDRVDLKKGDIVLSLKETEGITMIYVPTKDTPMALYGEIPSDRISQKVEDIKKGNQAIASTQLAYSGKDGKIIGTITGKVCIIKRDGEWCQVETVLSGGDNSQAFWVKADALSYNFDMKIMGKN